MYHVYIVNYNNIQKTAHHKHLINANSIEHLSKQKLGDIFYTARYHTRRISCDVKFGGSNEMLVMKR